MESGESSPSVLLLIVSSRFGHRFVEARYVDFEGNEYFKARYKSIFYADGVKELMVVVNTAISSGMLYSVVDLSKAKHFTDTAAGFLVMLFSRFRDTGGTIVCAGLNSRVEAFFNTLRLGEVFAVRGTVSEALSCLKEQA